MGAAGDALVDGVSCDALVVRLPLVMVLDVHPPPFPAEGLVGGNGLLKWSPVLAALAASGVGGCRW